MKIGSAFSGIGGFDLGLQRAGWDVRWQIENDRFCNKILERHWPEVTRYGDITTTAPRELERVDLICGGFPCQDLSVAGKRAGLAGERSGLFFEFMRIVGDVAPAWVLIENVPGLLSSNAGVDMGIVLRALGKLGYWWTYRVLDSQYFGVPQRRRRVYIVGHLGEPCPPEILFEPESVYRDTQARREAGQEVARAIRGRFDGGGDGSRNTYIVSHPDVAAPLTSGSGVTSNNPGRRREDDMNLVSHPLLANSNNSFDDSLETYVVRRAFGGSNGRGIDTDMTHTLDETGGGAVAFSGANSSSVRRLTPRECERLQGFPDDWTLHDSDAPRYRALGNAVTVNVAEWIGARLAQQVESSE